MPTTPPTSTPITIFLHSQAALGLGLLADFVFRYANRIGQAELFTVHLQSTTPTLLRNDVQLQFASTEATRPGGYLIIPPIEGFSGDFQPMADEIEIVREAARQGTTIASACLGAFFPAAAGLLDTRTATTHWAWGDYAAQRFPAVRWNVRAMLCDEERVITAGGLLAIVDLALYIVAQTCGKAFSHDLGQMLLADSIRQKQSLYARSLVQPARDKHKFASLEAALVARIANPPDIPEMAQLCNMSERSFQRHFTENYGMSPGKYLLLKKIEHARELLARTPLAIERVAEQSGFVDLSAFRSAFTRETGLTPSSYRKKLRSDQT